MELEVCMGDGKLNGGDSVEDLNGAELSGWQGHLPPLYA